MAKVQVTNVTVLDNPTAFLNPFQFEVTFECLEDLKDGEALLQTVTSMFVCVCSPTAPGLLFEHVTLSS